MITTILQGGMGNQLFQYAFGLAQAERLGTSLYLDKSRLGGNRSFGLSQWNISEIDYNNNSVPTVRENSLLYDRKLVDSIKIGDVVEGYWQSEKFFTNNVEGRLLGLRPKIRNASLDLNVTKEENSVAVHVRRGDYLREPHSSFHGILDWQTYYKPAMDYLRYKVHNPKFFIFTDDPIWVKENWYTDFSLGQQEVVYPSSEAADIFSMSLCTHAIIANSSFSWWGAWLGDNVTSRIVVCPERWFKDENGYQQSKDICPERWLRI